MAMPPASSPTPSQRLRIAGVCVAVVTVLLYLMCSGIRASARDPIVNVITDTRSADALLANFQDDVYEWLTNSVDLQDILETRHEFARLIEVERVDEKDLPFEKFYKEYLLKNKPVVITGLKSFKKPYTMDYLKKECGDAKVRPLIPSINGAGQWASLMEGPETTFETFVDTYGDDPEPRRYLHDFSLPNFCPQVLNNYIVPRYYVQNYLVEAKAQNDEGETVNPYRTYWPSIFVGGVGTGSGLHIDNSDTHFIMHMLEGKKDFRFIPPEDRILAYEDREADTFEADLFKPNFTTHPMMALATVYKTTLLPGDFMFFPGGSAHQTINRENAVAMSSNFVEDSNYERVARCLDDIEMYDLATSLREGGKKKWTTRMKVEDTPWPTLFPDLVEEED